MAAMAWASTSRLDTSASSPCVAARRDVRGGPGERLPCFVGMCLGEVVPPGPLGLQFQNGTCTVHAVKLRSPLRGVTKEGETLLAVNGRPVNAATMLDEIKGADDGTSERMLVFRRASSSKFLLAFGETENGPPAMAPIVSKENAV